MAAALTLYYGSPLANQLAAAWTGARPRECWTQLFEKIERLERDFRPRAGYLQELARSLTGSAWEFEAGARRMLGFLFPGELQGEIGQDFGLDGQLRLDNQVVGLVLKASKNALPPASLRKVWNDRESSEWRLLVVNPHARVLPLQRPALPASLQEEARRFGWALLESRELFQFHNRVLLERPAPAAVDWLQTGLEAGWATSA